MTNATRTVAYSSTNIPLSNGSSAVLSPHGNYPSAWAPFPLMTPSCHFNANKVPDPERSVPRQVCLIPPQKALCLQFLPFESP